MFDKETVERVARAILAADQSENDYLIQAAIPEAYATLLATAALAAAWEWKPIETAPRDGRYIVAAAFKADELLWVHDAGFVSAEEIAENEGGNPDDYEAGWVNSMDETEPFYPTHWLPLPAAPEVKP